MTAPSHQQRRALPAVIFIAALTVLTAIVWFRVLGHSDAAPTNPGDCSTPAAAAPTALPKPRAVSVLVLNSTFRNKLASKTKVKLVDKGFKVTQATNDEPSYGGHGVLTGVGEIRYGPGAETGARLLHYYLPGAKMVSTDSSSPTVILALGDKFDHFRSTESVVAELKQDKIGLAPTGVPSMPAAASPSC